MATSSALPSGLVVTVTPLQSAFFAGELFSATVTLSNPAPVVATAPTLHSLHSLASLSLPRTAIPSSPSAWSKAQTPSSRQRPPSASHLGLAEYATNHLDSDEIPPSPFIGSGAGGINGRYGGSSPSVEALPTPNSADFEPSFRSLSGTHTPVASTSKAAVPTRKGLIGTALPVPSTFERRNSGSGIYRGGPRKPGGHGRAQSMAVSSPDLLVGTTDVQSQRRGSDGSIKGHGKSRLGGSLGGDGLAISFTEDKRRSSAQSRVPSVIEEEPSSVAVQGEIDGTEDRPSPSGASQEQSNALSSTFSLAESASSDDEQYTQGAAKNERAFYSKGVASPGSRNGSKDSTGPTGARGSHSAGPASGSFDQSRERAASSGSIVNLNRATPGSQFLYPANTINVLWSFAHLEGTFETDDELVKPHEFNEVKRALLEGFGSGIGGGTLIERRTDGGWREWIWGSGEDGTRAGATLEERKNYSMREKSVPTFSSPPSILGVDLVLEPGESKSYTFSIRIPADLPPSFRGKAIKFSYHFVVGTARISLGTKISSGSRGPEKQTSRVMRVPVRVYNHVGVTGARPFYDLTNPIVYHRDEAWISSVGDVKDKRKVQSSTAGREAFEQYTASLLGSIASPGHSASSSLEGDGVVTMMEAVPDRRPEMSDRHGTVDKENFGGATREEDEGVGCKGAVEIVSRNSQKVSYDINKDGYMVATLTLVKSSYRLGETVNGSVVINSGEGRVLRVSARLETHELIETSIATKPAPVTRQTTRLLHSEHHETTLDSARVGFALAIPSGATPDFATSGVKLQWSVRLSFLVIPPSPDSPLEKPRTGKAKGATSGAKSPAASPAKGPIRHGRSKSFAYGFEPAVPLTLPAAPAILPTGATHLMPILDGSHSSVSYRAVPDLGFVPVLFSAATSERSPTIPGPLQRTAGGTMHKVSASLSIPKSSSSPFQQASVVLVPAKVETVECSIPIKVYPGNTPFRPTTTAFEA